MDEMLTQPDDTEQDARLDAEFNYVIGHTTLRDVTVDGQVVVPANTEVTAADAASALAAGVLEDLAFAVGAGDPSKTAIHAPAEDVDYTPSGPDPEADLTRDV
jgi:hypothetical protein